MQITTVLISKPALESSKVCLNVDSRSSVEFSRQYCFSLYTKLFFVSDCFL